jgi:hypothetical protein
MHSFKTLYLHGKIYTAVIVNRRLDDRHKLVVVTTLSEMACIPSEVRPSATATVDSRAAVASLVISSNAAVVKKVK